MQGAVEFLCPVGEQLAVVHNVGTLANREGVDLPQAKVVHHAHPGEAP